ncbi:diacylglycerol/lipid kinase family protein [Geodermatophilus poikilotrophus]|uniref:Diacylglycerol kinase family enzyme n=1 Tax=Geodermatophilus poikilotrophus TaxID=1333667 RepID=A0A1I0HQM5_9ACTN|nr:diacylglycerol kinase family protein [Geodermatophilus poikilotrophus]SET86302.1 Diacylglycerol kinase family enzyme [Geodermatophilus poikilotrophus]
MSDASRLLLVVNRAAGSAGDDAVEAAVRVLRAGADVEVVATGSAAELDAAVAGRDGRRLVVLGGDGSVHAVVRALDRAGALDPAEAVGIVARGTGNDLARTLGLPLDPEEGAAAVLAGRPRPLDLLDDDAGGLVVNAVHAGVGARAGAQADRLKERLGAAAYPVGAALAGVSNPGWPLRVEVDGRVATHPTQGWAADGTCDVLMLGVCTGRSIGGGTPLAPQAEPDDGLADVVVSVATGPVARAAFATALTGGDHVDRPDVLVLRGRRVSVTGGPVDLDADGEVEEGVPARTWRVRRHGWSVLVPPPR